MAVPGKKASQKLSSTLSRGGAEDFDIFCELCDQDDIRLPAFGYCVDCEEHLCQTCYKTHRRPKPLRHHQLLDEDHMPHKQDLNKSLKSTSGGPAQPKNKAAVPMKMSTPRKINVKSSSDKDYCNINGITVAAQNQLFVADCSNCSIKMIDIKTGAMKQRLLLKSEPWDITIVTRDTLAVTLPYDDTIQFISFSSDSLSLKNKLKLDVECRGISHHQGKLAISCRFSAQLQIIDLEGNIKITVEKDSNGDSIFSYPNYVTANSHFIYVSDIEKQEVTWFNWQGEMIGRFVDILGPRGISLLADGSLIVSDNYTGRIYRVSGDSKDTTTFLEGLEEPTAVCCCVKTNTLYFSSFSFSSTESRNIIKIYKMM